MYVLIEAATQQEHQRTAAASTLSLRRSICPSLTRSSRTGYYASGSPRFTITPTSSAGDTIAMNVEHESRSPLPQSSPQPPDPVHLPPSSTRAVHSDPRAEGTSIHDCNNPLVLSDPTSHLSLSSIPFTNMAISTKVVPKAVLYYDPHRVWSSAVRLALEEKGYGDDEVDFKMVDLAKGQNFFPSFLRLNPKGTLPGLIVPFENTLPAEIESRYKAVTDTTAIVELLDRSRSAMSRTHTTSFAPAPVLSPATISFSGVSKTIIDVVHAGPASPVLLFYMNARDSSTLQSVSKTVLPFLRGRCDALDRYLSDNKSSSISISEKTKTFWLEKKRATEELLITMSDAGKADAELSDQFSIADIHIVAWLAWLIKLSGGSMTDNGADAIRKLERHIVDGFRLPKDAFPPSSQASSSEGTTLMNPVAQAKLSIIWDNVKERPSWKKVYGGNA
ncbi:hypothetical protein EW146_g5646 [Bondarzewia mesenterica]|uniref:GST N-terminal domain-containing protein n=1 Tax=Bondarzewia mesenterica TaxID=1095465 RepID=A0A4V3XES2_9AGAM|nr:hypothetical protein EW146_g5646 [Bondarzewia mesenterica]